MITLSGAYGKGTVIGTLHMPDNGNSPQGNFTAYSHLDYALPLSDWYLPPPDGIWYSVVSSKYGPKRTKLLVGDIQSVNKNTDAWNPCKHSTISGDAYYRGNSDEFAPYWRKLVSNPKTDFTSVNDSVHPPVLQSSFISVLKGRPCTATDPYVHNYKGALAKTVLTTSNDGQRYYWLDTTLCANIAPQSLQLTLLQSGSLHRHGHWYARQVKGLLATNPVGDVHWYKTVWKRPDRTTFVRDQLCEYHTTASYTPASSTAWTGYGYVREANHRITTCSITHVRSDSEGRFQVKYDLSTDLSWFGWIPWSSFSGSSKTTLTGRIAALLILEPGLTPEATVDVTKANSYCLSAKQRAALLYDFKDAGCARTLAIRDVQELDSNWIENLAGVKGTLDCVVPLIDGYKAVKNLDPRAARKALASGYLAYKYAIAPNIADAKDLKKNTGRMLGLATVNRFSLERRRGAASRDAIAVCETLATLNYFTTYHLKLKDNYFSQVWNALEKFGLEPTASQLWDLIPLSFVADWFLPLGDTLKNLDSYNSLVLNRDILARIETFKVQWPIEEKVITNLFDGHVCSNGMPLEYSWYDRRIYRDAGQIDPISISDGNGLTTSQMTQGAALLTVMKRR